MNWEAIGHTAEHVFMRGLQNRLKVKPLKVEHKGMRGKITLEVEKLDWSLISEVVYETNRVIFEGRSVKEHFFQSLDEAKSRFPNLRAYEERIRGQVRVVEVEGYDWTACSRQHAKNTSEAKLFYVKDFSSKRRGLYEIDFSVADEAVKDISKNLEELGAASTSLHCKPWEVYERVNSLLKEVDALKRQRAKLTKQLLELQRPEEVKDLLIYSGVVEEVDERRFMEGISDLISDRRAVGIYAMISQGKCKVFIVRGKLDINCAELLRRGLKELGGSGGGKEEFAMGGVALERAKEAVEKLKGLVLRACSLM